MEPSWLLEKRRWAAGEFAKLPLPVNEEYWRRTRLDRLGLERFTPIPSSKNGASLAEAEKYLPVELKTAAALHYGEKTSAADLSPTLAKQGVVLCSLREGVEKFPETVQSHLGRGFKNRGEKFFLQNEAYWQTGAFCRIPPDVSLPEPILITSHFATPGRALYPRLLIVVERGARAVIVHHASSTAPEGGNHTNGVFEIYLEEGASLDFIDLQALSTSSVEISLKRAELEANAQLKWILDLQGGKVSKTDIETVLMGNGANAGVYGLLCGKESQHLELYSRTQHVGRNTTADILVKGSARDRAKIIFQGMIRIEKSAQQTLSYMANHNLVLSDAAHADSIPRLEIEADDVKASHGASIGQVDKEQMFYLCSKGLSATMAERLLVEGFYEEIFGHIPLEPIRELLRKNLECGKGDAV